MTGPHDLYGQLKGDTSPWMTWNTFQNSFCAAQLLAVNATFLSECLHSLLDLRAALSGLLKCHRNKNKTDFIFQHLRSRTPSFQLPIKMHNLWMKIEVPYECCINSLKTSKWSSNCSEVYSRNRLELCKTCRNLTAANMYVLWQV